MKDLSPEELERYDRQIRVWGVEAQKKLKSSTVLVVGAGGLGSPVAFYLVAAGVGKLIIVDAEDVELSNLNRQILHWTSDLGKAKVESAKEKLEKLNPHVEVVTLKQKIRSLEDALKLVEDADVVVDCLDNWSTRFLLNEACVKLGKPLVHGAVRGLYGQLTVVKPFEGPCLRCILPREPPEERPFPVAGPTPGVIGSLEALEVIKILTGYGEPMVGRLLFYDGVRNTFDVVKVERRPDCPVCGVSVRKVASGGKTS
ncbi:UBA/THIF-type NAD/FAD binding protein [Thermofilum pendens Hrk 5]|uniref:UBA/THIF-type NAD/FAD binding protein n=1 Tax=Thermofilum pendens (strain DSM 2475 / Hrk 5) TaxID=368408 RepID=A1S187_THEPD|nr:HesA/MoeB/ThiF family protein [Thermofilum pendens]ABL79217.1 UBA/THIF-type NAD/FAD binding protein [Thermofilum pendens Hrk 5]